MINLIPPSAQKQVKREYWLRVFSVWMFIIGTAFFIVAVLNAPVYVLVRSQLKSYLEAYNQASDESQSFVESEQEIQRANQIAKLLATSDSVTPFSKVIADLDNLTDEGIYINDFNFVRSEGSINSIVIKGEATSRLMLSKFQTAIEDSELFESATLPLSNLAKDRDIPFVITVVPNKQMQ